jgi:hypothetical protein
MPMGPLNPLTFLAGSTPPGAARAKERDADPANAAASSVAARSVPQSRPEPENAGVILSLQSGATGAGTGALPQDLVYSNGRKSLYSQAQERSAGRGSNLSLDGNGVLLARPATPGELRAQEFMQHAVSTMRDYADAQERLKSAGTSADGDAAASAALRFPRSLAEVQKLAARFKLFA